MNIKINNVIKKEGNNYILKGLTHTFVPEQMNIIIGESGSGKTTLLNIVSLFDNNFDGEVYFDNHKVSDYSKNKKTAFIRENIGFIFQDIRIFEFMSVEENLKLAFKYSNLKYEKSKVDIVLSRLGISNLKFKKCDKLSGGEKQRVAIARCLVTRKKVIFADEPTGALDTKNSDNIIEIFKEIIEKDKITVIMVTHSSKISQQFRNKLCIADGMKIETH